MSADRLLVRELSVQAGERTLLREISLELRGGELTLLVGSSGAGKSVLCRALVGLTLARPGLVAGTVSLLLDGQERPIFGSGRPRFEEARGPLSWLPQHGQGALDPLMTVRSQLQEAAGTADPATLDDALAAAGFDPREAPLDRYPHQLSGGMAQRVALARALLRRARILLVDEPTTGLDPGAAAVVLDTLGRLRDRGVGLLLISHDLRLAPRVADRILFLDRGRLVESVEGSDPRAARSPEARALVEATRRVAGGAF